jgi:hypothetical protein
VPDVEGVWFELVTNVSGFSSFFFEGVDSSSFGAGLFIWIRLIHDPSPPLPLLPLRFPSAAP